MSRRDSPAAAPWMAACSRCGHRLRLSAIPASPLGVRPVTVTIANCALRSLPVAVGHLGERRDIVRDDRIDHHRAEERKLGDEARLLRRECRALVDETVERRPRALEVVRGAGDGAARRDARRRHHDRRKRERDQQKDAGRHAGFHAVVPPDLLPNRGRHSCSTIHPERIGRAEVDRVRLDARKIAVLAQIVELQRHGAGQPHARAERQALGRCGRAVPGAM